MSFGLTVKPAPGLGSAPPARLAQNVFQGPLSEAVLAPTFVRGGKENRTGNKRTAGGTLG